MNGLIATGDILCIEDDEGLGRLLERRLLRAGYRVTLTDSVRSGVEQAQQGGFDLAVVDYWLPDGDGLAVLDALAEVPDAPPVVMVTGAADVDIAVKSMRAGAEDYLIKDVAGRYLELLPSVIDRVLRQRHLEREREEARAFAEATLGSIGDAVITTDCDGVVTYMNPVAEKLTGWDKSDAGGQSLDAVFRLTDEGNGRPLPCPARTAIDTGRPVLLSNHALLERVDGSRIPVMDSAAPILDHAGRLLGAVVVFQDVTELRKYQRSLRLFEKVFKYTAEAIVITDASASIVDVNEAFTRITGYDREEVVGRDPGMMKSGRHDEAFFSDMWRSLSEIGSWKGEIWDRRKDGDVYPKWLSINSVGNSSGEVTHYVGIFSDITAIKETEEHLHRLAHYDPLTGLPNRVLFYDRLEQKLRQAERNDARFAVMFIDLDRFKFVNDTMGHSAGDQLLVAVARRLEQQIRRSDTVARLGGDEFTVILGDSGSREAVAQVAQKIIDAFAAPFTVAGEQVFTSPSIGISRYPVAGDDVESLTKAADIAMYQAKERGRNNYQFFRDHVDAFTRVQLRTEGELRRALSDNQFRVAYQPQVALDGSVLAVEALVRWAHPERGLLDAKEFIGLAEETGLIVGIGDWVLRTACADLRRWLDAGLDPGRLAVNVSARQLEREGFVDWFLDMLRQEGLEPARLEVELTENSILTDGELAGERLEQLREAGVRVAIDDFGSGYSSLAYLRRFPVDTLKIDREFIQDIASNGSDAAISRGIIALGRSLELRVVAEGVESADQLAILRREQCTGMQGFFLSRPLLEEDMEQLLRNGWQAEDAG